MATNDAEPRHEGVRSIARAIDLLSLFDLTHPSRTVPELAAATGLPKTTVVRLAATLESRGVLTRRAEQSYGLGPRFLGWVQLAQTFWEVDDRARAVMRELVDECGETVNIYVRQGIERVSIAQVEGTATVRSVVAVGEPMPLSQGATARVLLAGVASEVVDTLADALELDRETLARMVASVRETGYAVTHGERELGASAVAAPIRAADGRVLAALSASGPTSRFTADRISGYVESVTAAADRISGMGLGGVEAFL